MSSNEQFFLLIASKGNSMKWIRCKSCGDLKQEIEFYKLGDERRNVCKKCMHDKYFSNKEKKAKYDKERYEKKKREEKDERHICMRCGKYYANVRNNELEWCFHCLKHYEEVYEQKIKVEIILPYYRRVKNVWNEEQESL